MSAFADWHLARFTWGGHGLAVYPAGASFGPRTLGDFEFVWIVDGDVTWIADGVEHAAPPGTVTLARPGMRDAYRWDARRDSRHGFVHFSLDLAGATSPPTPTWPVLRRYGADSIVLPLLRHLLGLVEERPAAWEELAQGAARQVLLAFLTGNDAVAGDESPPPPPPVERALQRLREAWRGDTWSPLSITALARAAGVTREHLARAFHNHFATSPREAQLLLRLDRSAHLLGRTSLPIGDIARLCGFADQFHFSRRFRTAYGRSPRAFRHHLAAGGSMPMNPLTRVRNLILGQS